LQPIHAVPVAGRYPEEGSMQFRNVFVAVAVCAAAVIAVTTLRRLAGASSRTAE
jgi:hypothetical protein